MSEIKKIGMYTTDEILEHLTEGEGRGFLGRSMYDAIYFKIEKLETQLQQKENIIKEVREYIECHTPSDIGIGGNKTKKYYTLGEDSVDHILEILDKGDKGE